MSLDLLLVNAPARAGVYGQLAALSAIEPPVWAGLIARYCLNKGFSVQILDAEAEDLDVAMTAERILALRPRLAAFCIYGHQPSASTQCLPAASSVARLVQGKVPTLALGTHPSALPERTIHEEPFDFVCQGEGPHTVDQLLHGMINLPEAGKHIGVEGMFGPKIGADGYVKPWRAAPLIENLDRDLPSQAWELLRMDRYRAHNWHLWTGSDVGGYASVQTSLGCPFKCSFCCINASFTAGGARPQIRKWSAANVVDQIDTLVKEYGITNLKIPDEMFLLDRHHVRSICEELLHRGLGWQLNIWAYARVDTVKDDALLELMLRAGFRWLGIGVESASKHVRDGVEKGRMDNRQIIDAIRRVQGHGLAVAANYIFGLPDDTRESCAETLALALEINAEMANFYCAMAYPGSQLYRLAKEKGWALPDDPGGPGWIGYSQHAPESLPLRTEKLTSSEVLDIRDDAWMTYFTRPEYVEMMRRRFGERVAQDIISTAKRGKPDRLHRRFA